MAYSVFEIANYFIKKAQNEPEKAITNLKLQKLVYYAQAWHLAMLNEKLFSERIEAWVHGPVCPDLYYEYKEYGYKEITNLTGKSPSFPPDTLKVMEAVWKAYGKYTGRYLESLSHSEDPWIKARGNKSEYEYSNEEISPEEMKKYYKKF